MPSDLQFGESFLADGRSVCFAVIACDGARGVRSGGATRCGGCVRPLVREGRPVAAERTGLRSARIRLGECESSRGFLTCLRACTHLRAWVAKRSGFVAVFPRRSRQLTGGVHAGCSPQLHDYAAAVTDISC